MTTTEAAALIGCSVRHVRTMIKGGRLKASRLVTHTNRYGFLYSVRQRDAEREAKRYDNDPQRRGFPRGQARK